MRFVAKGIRKQAEQYPREPELGNANAGIVSNRIKGLLRPLHFRIFQI